MDQQDRIVYDDADQDDEAEQGQHVELLELIDIQNFQADHAACRRDGYRQHDDQGIEEAFEQHGHHQEHDREGQDQIEP